MRRWTSTATLAAWTGFLAWLYFSGEVARYLGPRTYWVVPAGALLLAAVTLAHVAADRQRGDGPSPSEVAGMGLMLVPIAAVLISPAPQLGSLAASRKSLGPVGAGTVVTSLPSDGEISFADLELAAGSAEYASAAGVVDGARVELTGFVVARPDGVPGEFDLTRFYVFCCAADAVPYSVRVQSASDYRQDEWLTVSGALERRTNGWTVMAERIRRVAPPDNPYLY